MGWKRSIATGALLLAVGAFGSSCTSGPTQQSQAMRRACADLRRMGGIKVSPVPEGSPNAAVSFQTVTIWNPQELKNSGNAVLARLPSEIQRDSGSLSGTEAVLREAAAQCRGS